jgi:hypothetical protein
MTGPLKAGRSLGIFLAGVVSGGLLISSANADQPHMQAALDFLQSALHELQSAEPNKGGHRHRAVGLVKRAIEETEAGIQYAE